MGIAFIGKHQFQSILLMIKLSGDEFTSAIDRCSGLMNPDTNVGW